MADEILCIITDILPIPFVEDDSSIGALFDEVLEILATERRVSTEKGICYNTEGPHIHWLAVAFLEHYLGRCIAKRPGHGCENFVFRVEHFGNAKISENEIRMRIRGQVQKILGFEIFYC
jgi:hypothetical protein